jgi:ubiquinone/menaquinone biosynthesis C-methylase UbiE
MGFYNDHVVPRLVHWTLKGKDFAPLRTRVVQGLSGTVLEVGFGSGLNLPCYPAGVEKLYAVEPSEDARRLARRAIAQAPFPVELVADTAESLPLPDASVDAAVSTWTLCTISDVHRALGEIRRVLRPGGVFRFIEHGLSPQPRVARWQHRLDPLQQRLAGGCHLNRQIDRLVEGAGFRLEEIQTFYLSAPKIWTWSYLGKAAR